jgi:hypothetical protein
MGLMVVTLVGLQLRGILKSTQQPLKVAKFNTSERACMKSAHEQLYELSYSSTVKMKPLP